MRLRSGTLIRYGDNVEDEDEDDGIEMVVQKIQPEPETRFDTPIDYMLSIEDRYQPNISFEDMPYINVKMRAIAVDWIVDVHKRQKMHREVLSLACSIFDRYQTVHRGIRRAKYQLVVSCSLMLASKLEDIEYSEFSDFVYLCDGAYSRVQEFIDMETQIASELSHDLWAPTSYTFLWYLCKGNIPRRCQYLCEEALVAHHNFKPSVIACAAMCIEKKTGWETLYSEEDLVEAMHFLRNRPEYRLDPPLTAVRRKFSIW